MTKRFGFTLAEVLITLGIIGVVAAMTMPTLMNSTQGAQYKAAYKKALSALSQAVTLNVALDEWNFADATGDGDYTIANLLSKLEGVDYIVAPIADNRMFEIIDSFIDGEITDAQCQHCLSATNLGNQYVFVTDKSLKQLKVLRHCYLAPDEKDYYLTSKKEESRIGNDKVKIARKQYRGQGEYIEEILK